MVIDTSAIMAFLLNEPEAEWIESTLAAADGCLLSAFTLFECRTVLLRRLGPASLGELETLVQVAQVTVSPFDAEQSALAFEAYRRYGKGCGHPAQLNLGDCAAYALAISKSSPLLFKGEDFVHTDVIRCPCPAL
ncbi:VapC toxin family PIN domain ribonuclease [Paramagnetospirillum kuznetsovii]|uniref:Ribonuclease VapC n=1 Tax=Paramagnetospirillum kuznetsovii TaxID=2053833 RepID=A0A364NXG4_9PROT|nr:VapC toxin family PIN domain ribonuclease [Paramagnetospirillum kuznetsovii]